MCKSFPCHMSSKCRSGTICDCTTVCRLLREPHAHLPEARQAPRLQTAPMYLESNVYRYTCTINRDDSRQESNAAFLFLVLLRKKSPQSLISNKKLYKSQRVSRGNVIHCHPWIQSSSFQGCKRGIYRQQSFACVWVRAHGSSSVPFCLSGSFEYVQAQNKSMGFLCFMLVRHSSLAMYRIESVPSVVLGCIPMAASWRQEAIRVGHLSGVLASQWYVLFTVPFTDLESCQLS